MNVLYKFRLLFLICVNEVCFSLMIKNKFKTKLYDDLYGEELNAITEAFNASNKLYSNKHTNLFSDTYTKLDKKEVTSYASNLMKGDKTTAESFRKLNDLANKVNGGDDELKNNGLLNKTLKVMLKDPSMKIDNRIKAAQLATRLTNVPVTIQMTSQSTSKKPKNFDAYVIVPRATRIYRPDKLIENFKAGNWDA